MKNNFKVVFVIIGALVGAGFASGQEINAFFYAYGKYGIFGMLVCSALIGVVIYKVFKIITRYDINTYEQLLEKFITRKQRNKYLNVIFITNTIINIFLLITFSIMIAGFGAYFEQELGISSIIGSIILAVLSFAIFMSSSKGVVKASELLVPILIIFIVIIGGINFNEIELSNIRVAKNDSWILSSVLYCSYNSILLIPVLITLKDFIKNEKDIKLISMITGIIIFVLSTIIYSILIKVDVDINNLQMPVVYVIRNFYPTFKNIYGFIILSSIFTTSISIGVSFLQNVAKNKKSYTQIAVIMCITSVLVSNLGFSNLVNLLYPVFGYLGLIQIWFLLKK